MMSNVLFCPSLMCADFRDLKNEVQQLDSAGADIFHIDIMDGTFVSNFGMGLQDVEVVRQATDKLIDVHLMINNPENHIELFANTGVDIIYIHAEATQHPARVLDMIKKSGKKAGLAINPGTSVSTVRELLPLIDYCLVMTVNPGFARQTYLDYVDNKIEEIVDLSKSCNYEVMVDGAISPEKIKGLQALGVTGFILGTSTLFGKEEPYEEIFHHLREMCEDGGR